MRSKASRKIIQPSEQAIAQTLKKKKKKQSKISNGGFLWKKIQARDERELRQVDEGRGCEFLHQGRRSTRVPRGGAHQAKRRKICPDDHQHLQESDSQVQARRGIPGDNARRPRGQERHHFRWQQNDSHTEGG